jgi:glycosyltransferase involved in cell wall biosynthesis
MNPLLHILLGAERGGCEFDALCLIRSAREIDHHVLLLSPPGPMSSEFEDAGATVEHVPLPRKGARRALEAVAETAGREAPLGVIAWHGMVLLPEILHALRDFPGRVLVHGGNPAHSMPRRVDWRYCLREKWLGARCEATYVCCSQHVADSFECSRYLRRFPRVVVFNGVKALTVPPHVPREIGPGSPFVIGMVARLDRIKDHATLLRAFALVGETIPEARLELAGDGELRGELETLARDLGISDRVSFLGMVSDVYRAMSRWDLFAYTTTDREGLGNAVSEAMMFGLPCVLTEVGPMPELAGDRQTVSLVPKNDPAALAREIAGLIPNLPRRSALSAAALVRARAEFSGDVFAQRHLALLGS